MGGLSMNKTITAQGIVRGKTIDLDRDIGMADGQPVEVVVKVVELNGPASPAMSEGLAKIYAVLGERYESGHSDTAARHDEHQP
jgi:hypothetical protein